MLHVHDLAGWAWPVDAMQGKHTQATNHALHRPSASSRSPRRHHLASHARTFPAASRHSAGAPLRLQRRPALPHAHPHPTLLRHQCRPASPHSSAAPVQPRPPRLAAPPERPRPAPPLPRFLAPPPMPPVPVPVPAPP
ncbi:hypothetical protein BS78_04G134900 [Paspalum vaginatum]|nr:hypothetical protein BS78_04G134900 [Paspalum vaginatum]